MEQQDQEKDKTLPEALKDLTVDVLTYTPITKQDILNAYQRIVSHIHKTPILTNSTINAMTGMEIFFKCENFQKIGAFKIRGGLNSALGLTPAQLDKGLATHSSGNHAQAIAFAAKILNTKAYIVMPSTSPKVKVDAVKGYGAQVIFCEPNQTAREEALNKIVAETGAEFIHPYDDDRVITGQATCFLEIMDQVKDLDVIITPCGGGGLLSGTCLSVHYFQPSVLVYGAEPEGAADAVYSIQTGKVEKAKFVKTIADGLLTSLSERTLAIIKNNVKEILLVSDDEIKAALKIVYERMKIVVEPSCVTPLAVAIRYKEKFQGKKVAMVLTGGNVDLKKFQEWFA